MSTNEAEFSRRTVLKGVGSLGLAAASPKLFAATANASSIPPPDPLPSPVNPTVPSLALGDVDTLRRPFCLSSYPW